MLEVHVPNQQPQPSDDAFESILLPALSRCYGVGAVGTFISYSEKSD